MKNSSRRWPFLFFLIFLPIPFFLGCAAIQEQLNKMAALSQCQFRLASVENTSLAGISLQDKVELSDINPLALLKLHSAFNGGSLPLQFTLNLEAQNPNHSPAGMNRMEWILFLDGTRLTSGLLEKEVEIPAEGGRGTFPLLVNLDLRKTLSGKTLDSLVQLSLNIAGEGTKPTRITLQVKPSIKVGGQTLDYPDYITINHEFGSN